MDAAQVGARAVARAQPGARTLLAATGLLLATVATSAPPAAAFAGVPDAGPALTAAGPPSSLGHQGGLPAAGRPRATLLLPGFGSVLPTDAPRLGLPETVPESRAAAAPAVPTSPRISGLPWRSGASCADPRAFAAWRGRALDAHVLFSGRESWDAVLAHLSGPYFRSRVRETPQPVVSIALLPATAARQYAACASGAFDARFRQYGAVLQRVGAGGAVVRLGWEANLGTGSHPWGIDRAGDIPAYKACFRRAAAALKQGAPGLKIEWTNAKRGKLPVSILESYPGDDVVDLWGVHYYDNMDPKLATQTAWNALYGATIRGGPFGIGEWLKAAKARGKKLAVSEWGVWSKGDGSAADTPVYIDNMYRFFRLNAADIAYESYFNCLDRHRFHPSSAFPKASARYRALWSGGR